jgi:hypothetical protein
MVLRLGRERGSPASDLRASGEGCRDGPSSIQGKRQESSSFGHPGGCIGGGGQPIPTSPEIRAARAKAIYSEDAAYEIRKSHENPAVLEVYEKFLTDGPCGHKSHHLLHTQYTPRGKYIA